MHATDDPRLYRFLDGFDLSQAVLEMLHADLHCLVGTLLPRDVTGILKGISLSWSIVDAVHRCRELAQSIPGLSKKEPEVRAFLEATTLAEEFRHYIQHLRNEVAKPSIDNFPVWGSFSWVDSEDVCHTVCQGTMLPGVGFSSCVFDKQEWRWVSRATLSIRGMAFNIDPICGSTIHFCKYVREWIGDVKGDNLKVMDRLPCVSIAFKKPSAQPDGAPAPTAPLEKHGEPTKSEPDLNG